MDCHKSGTCLCCLGSIFSTRGEVRLCISWEADVIVMPIVPACVLAREDEICYASISTVTDYDSWKDHPVTAGEVGRIMRENIEKVKKLIKEAIRRIPEERACECKSALRSALV